MGCGVAVDDEWPKQLSHRAAPCRQYLLGHLANRKDECLCYKSFRCLFLLPIQPSSCVTHMGRVSQDDTTGVVGTSQLAGYAYSREFQNTARTQTPENISLVSYGDI